MSAVLAPLRVVVIGPECTGKTWLAQELAGHYSAPWSPEYARAFVEANPRPVVYEDVEAIGRGQLAGEDEVLARARAMGARLVVHDTDLVSTAVYSRHYYGGCPAWIEKLARERRADLYLLHHTDVAWVPDGHQREEPRRREELMARFRATLAALGACVAEIFGTSEERRRRAIEAAETRLAARS